MTLMTTRGMIINLRVTFVFLCAPHIYYLGYYNRFTIAVMQNDFGNHPTADIICVYYVEIINLIFSD